MNLTKIITGPDGHPFHPPITDLPVGAFTVASACAVAGFLGFYEKPMLYTIIVCCALGLLGAFGAIITGYFEWRKISTGTKLKKNATSHGLVMLLVAFLYAGLLYTSMNDLDRASSSVSVLTVALAALGGLLLALGGALGGHLVFHHGMRVEGPEKG